MSSEEELRTLKELEVRWDFLSHPFTSLYSTDEKVMPKGTKAWGSPQELEFM